MNILLNLINKMNLLISSKFQTKIWRQNQKWYKNGRKNECENYQRNIIEEIVKYKCNKTNIRINMDTYELENIKYPLKYNNGFIYTEDFDGFIEIKNNILYFNMKQIHPKPHGYARSGCKP